MRPVATDVAHSIVCVTVCVLYLGHMGELWKNRWTNQGAIWGSE